MLIFVNIPNIDNMIAKNRIIIFGKLINKGTVENLDNVHINQNTKIIISNIFFSLC